VKVAHFKQVGCKFGRWLDVVYMELLLYDLPGGGLGPQFSSIGKAPELTL